ncbi:cation diffusion facilitator family transporter [Reyranella sp.]|jgi:cobalt-zinc-cadmium efflux system protein|uniref:cation diffusion facilitator family transporter n=1 Tax=Reyranella sp. TaxID=1929291 RepID=UPI002F926BF6
MNEHLHATPADGHSHSRGHSHAHGHSHGHAPVDFNRAFAIGVALNAVFVVVEAVYGFLANSLALLADAGHNLGDVLGLLLAWGAAALVKRRPTDRHTYGLKRSSILASLTNAILLLVGVGMIVWEAVHRLARPEAVAETTVLWVAAVGIVVNTVTALMFVRGGKSDINIRGAFLHMAADAAVSLGVVIAALAVMATGWLWLDPAVSIVIAIVIMLGTWSLFTASINLALDAIPQNIDRRAIEAYLASLPGVTEVHDLHIWGMSTTEIALTAHLVRPDCPVDDGLLGRSARELAEKFGIGHSTIQIESGDPDHPCRLAPAEVV